jgi:hypothetical protein
MRFKLWFQMTENLAGPGGGPDFNPDSQEALARTVAAKGAGAFPTGGDKPPKPAKTATAGYLDPRFAKKTMRKK